MCLVCLAVMLLMCLVDLAGFPLIRGNPLPETVQAWIEKHPKAVICGEVQSCQDTEFSFSVYLKQVYLINQSEKFPIENVRMFLKTKEELPAGTIVWAAGTLERVEGPRNPGEFDSRQYYACQHIYYFLKNAEIEKKSRTYSGYQQRLLDLKDKLCGILEKAAGEDAPVFEAMLLGEKTDLDSELKLRYQMGGMIHILAISGLHISILGMGLFQLLKRIGFGNTGAGIIALGIMLQYGMLTGGSVSAMRAVCMFLLSVGAKIIGRSYDLLTALALSAILLLLDSPAYLYSSSFLLSFGAVAGLGAVSSFLLEITGAKNKWFKSFLSSLSVQIATLPVMLVFFGEVSLAGIFLNLFVLPTVSGVLISGLCACILGLFSIKAAVIAAVPGRALLFLYEQSCILAGKLPFCTWVGGLPEIWQSLFYYGCLVLGIAGAVWMARRQAGPGKRGGVAVQKAGLTADIAGKGRSHGGKLAAVQWVGGKIKANYAALFLLAALSAGILVLSWKDRGGLRITCLDVGQGDGIVLEMPGGGVFLMDCGSSSQKNVGQYQLLPYLKSRGITVLEGIMVSHTDTDHISGIQELLDFMAKGLSSVKVKKLLLPAWAESIQGYDDPGKQDPENTQGEKKSLYGNEEKKDGAGALPELAERAGVEVIFAGEGDGMSFGEVEMRFLAPMENASGEDVNEEGLVMELRYRTFRGLFTGDIGEETEQDLLQAGALSDIYFLKVAHHGSRYSTCGEFLEVVKPELAVISCSDSNTYGHPSPETVERLEESGARIAYTMKSGAVTVRTDGEKIRAEGFRRLDNIFVNEYNESSLEK